MVVNDDVDLCPGTATGDPVDADGCSDAQLDTDGDGVPDTDDVCPATVIPEAAPTSSRGLGRNRWTLDNPDGSFHSSATASWIPLRFYYCRYARLLV